MAGNIGNIEPLTLEFQAFLWRQGLNLCLVFALVLSVLGLLALAVVISHREPSFPAPDTTLKESRKSPARNPLSP